MILCQETLQTLAAIAREAGDIQKTAFALGRPSEVTEKGPHDFVTSVDRACEARVLAALGESFPGIPVLAEEGGGGASGGEGLLWCVDPLDGTNNFVHGVPIFCVSIGLVEDGKPRLGVVYDPMRDELFEGGEGLGASLNGCSVAVSRLPALRGAFLATGFPYREFRRLEDYIRGFRKVVRKAGGVRRCGSAALDICYTACGRFDGFWEMGLSPWDMAAGTAILRAAGGTVSDFDGMDGFLFGGDIVAGATEALCSELRGLVK